MIHGAHKTVDFICDHPDIRAISFVGSDQAVSEWEREVERGEREGDAVTLSIERERETAYHWNGNVRF